MTNLIHISLDLETWGNQPGRDLRSIGACVFDPVYGYVAEPCGDENNDYKSFYIATYNPLITHDEGVHLDETTGVSHWDKTSAAYRKYPLTRDPETVKWWSEQSAEAQAAFADPVDLREALLRFANWVERVIWHYPNACGDGEPNVKALRIWSHGAAYDPPILAAAFEAVGLPVPWNYRAPRDTRTAFELAGIDPVDWWKLFPQKIHHHALHDSIAQARCICEAHRRLRVPHDVITHRDNWRSGLDAFIIRAKANGEGDGVDESYWRHERDVFDRTFDALVKHPLLER